MRDADKAKKLEPFGVKTVIGSFKSDLALLTQEVEKVHVVFNIVSEFGFRHIKRQPLIPLCAQGETDDLTVIDAILAGTKKRHTETGDVPIFIHTVSPSLELSVIFQTHTDAALCSLELVSYRGQ